MQRPSSSRVGQRTRARSFICFPARPQSPTPHCSPRLSHRIPLLAFEARRLTRTPPRYETSGRQARAIHTHTRTYMACVRRYPHEPVLCTLLTHTATYVARTRTLAIDKETRPEARESPDTPSPAHQQNTRAGVTRRGQSGVMWPSAQASGRSTELLSNEQASPSLIDGSQVFWVAASRTRRPARRGSRHNCRPRACPRARRFPRSRLVGRAHSGSGTESEALAVVSRYRKRCRTGFPTAPGPKSLSLCPPWWVLIRRECRPRGRR